MHIATGHPLQVPVGEGAGSGEAARTWLYEPHIRKLGEPTPIQAPASEQKDCHQTRGQEESQQWSPGQLLASPDKGQQGEDDRERQAQQHGLAFEEDTEVRKAVNETGEDGGPPRRSEVCRSTPCSHT